MPVCEPSNLMHEVVYALSFWWPSIVLVVLGFAIVAVATSRSVARIKESLRDGA